MERLADFIYDGEFDAKLIDVESEHSAISACLGAQATGVRTFTATASQGLALMHEVLFIVSGMRLPIVMAVANRALSAPINIWNDHQDSISSRDAGWLQLYVESAQEALDTVIMAYKIAENRNVLLPVMVCLDGFTLSHVYEPVDIPEQKAVDRFLPQYKPLFKLDPLKPLTMGPVAFPDSFIYFKHDQQKAMLNAVKVIKEANIGFKKEFKRGYGDGMVEAYRAEGATTAIVAMGSICGTAKEAVDELRKKGKRVGLIRIKCFRPFPEKELANAVKNIKILNVIDRDISLGGEGALLSDIKSALFGMKIQINGFIAGLGGRDITKENMKEVLATKILKKTEWIL